MLSICRIVCLFLLLSFAALATAQERPPNPIRTGAGVSPKLPTDAFLYATIDVKALVSMWELRLVPWEVISAAGIDNLGFDPLTIERLDLVMGFLGEAPQPSYVIVARTNKLPQIKPEFAEQLLEQQGLSTVTLNDRFTLVGNDDYMRRMVNEAPADGELKRQVARFNGSSIAWAVMVLDPIRTHVDAWAAATAADRRELFERIGKNTKLIAANLDTKEQCIPVVLETASDADAVELQKALGELFQGMMEVGDQQFQTTAAGLPESVQAALSQFHERFRKEFATVSQIERKGKQLACKFTPDYWEVSQMGTNVTIVAAMVRALQVTRR